MNKKRANCSKAPRMFIMRIKKYLPSKLKFTKHLEFIKKFRDAIYAIKDLAKLLLTVASIIPIVLRWFD